MGGENNNPIRLALLEKRCIWPQDPEPAVVLSLGTGTAHEVHSPQAKPAHSFLNGFLSRTYRSRRATFESQKIWWELWNGLEERNRQDYFRLNVGFPGPEPAINDAACMEELSNCVQTRPQGPSERFETMSALLISNLYFELDELATYQSGFYHCKGSIRCRLNAHAIIRAILRLHSDDIEICSDGTPTGYKLTERDICPTCYIYRRPVEFLRRSTSDGPLFSLKWKGGCARKLGPMRESISWFEQQQGLRDVFGSSNHGRPYAVKCPVCSMNTPVIHNLHKQKQRKHANNSPTLPPPKKQSTVGPRVMPHPPLQR
jgi:hypothetical protein